MQRRERTCVRRFGEREDTGGMRKERRRKEKKTRSSPTPIGSFSCGWNIRHRLPWSTPCHLVSHHRTRRKNRSPLATPWRTGDWQNRSGGPFLSPFSLSLNKSPRNCSWYRSSPSPSSSSTTWQHLAGGRRGRSGNCVTHRLSCPCVRREVVPRSAASRLSCGCPPGTPVGWTPTVPFFDRGDSKWRRREGKVSWQSLLPRWNSISKTFGLTSASFTAPLAGPLISPAVSLPTTGEVWRGGKPW
mmetsp:Transcript_5580/g.12928  ORF Transcript_5580/g.12928 Transcript_5580/m.12928 type:complete len:244 (+) Transcript_5580:756-1487(+)